MSRIATGRKHTGKRDLLTAILTLCCHDSTLSEEVLSQLIEEAKVQARKRVEVLRPCRNGIIEQDALGHVIYLWQRKPKYLDDKGRPLALKAKGRAPSIEALFRETGRSDYFRIGLKHLRDVGRIKRASGGRFLPCAEVSIFQSLSPELVELLAQTINRVVATVLHNTSLKNKKSVRLIERVTAVPDLPRHEIAAFKLFAREQGGALINTTNDWLERRRGEGTPRRASAAGRVTAGLHVFAFVEKNSS